VAGEPVIGGHDRRGLRAVRTWFDAFVDE